MLSASIALSLGAALAPAVAAAGVAMSVVPSVPANLTVGQSGVASSITIANASFNGPGEAGFDLDTLRVDTIALVPSCGSTAFGADCPVGLQDPGVIVPSPETGTGRAGTACAAQTFTFAVVDAAQRKYSVTSTSPPLLLGPSSGSAAVRSCVIDYTAQVARAPIDANPAQPGLQTVQRAAATGTDIGPTISNLGLTASGIGTSVTTIAGGAATPVIATAASGAIELGGTVTDTATISGLVNAVPGGTVEFRLYGPGDPTCSVPVFTSSGRPITLSGTVGTATSASFTPAAAGTYRWRALYSGDANNLSVSGPCNAPNENVVVSDGPSEPGTGDLVGVVTDTAGPGQKRPRTTRAAVPNAAVEACPSPLDGDPCHVTQTDGGGSYAFHGIDSGAYRLTANPPPGDTTHTQGQAGPVTVPAGGTASRNIVLGFAQSLPPGTSVGSAIGTSNGVPVVHWTTPLQLSTTACADGAVSYSVTVAGTVVSSGPMTRGAVSGASALYSVTAPPLYPAHGTATVTFTISGCPDNTPIEFNIYIDPSGNVITARDGLPIAGATVRLLRSDSASGPFTYVPNGSAIMSPSNRDNPDTTSASGAFGWDVVAGYYVVHAAKAGCGPTTGSYPGTYPGTYPGENPASTPVLQIPPPALNLEIRMDCGGPRAQASRGSLTFPTTAVGATSAPQTFDITNTGAERLHLTLPLAPSTGNAADFAVTSTCAAAIDPGAGCTATVRFAPKAPTGGTRGSKVVLAGDGDGPTPSVALSGTTPAAPPPPPPPPPAPPKFAAGCIKAVTTVAANRFMTFRCRLSRVDGARYIRISRSKLRGRVVPFRSVQSRTVRLVKGRATIRLRLTRVEARRVRRAGRRGLTMAVRAQALSPTRSPLARQTKRTRVRRA